jgi:hypothetical protein
MMRLVGQPDNQECLCGFQEAYSNPIPKRMNLFVDKFDQLFRLAREYFYRCISMKYETRTQES